MGCGGSTPADFGGDGGDGGGDGAKFGNITKKGWVVDEKAIGEGGFGAVHLCTSTKSGKQRACKAMRLPNSMDREDFRAEVLILSKCGKHKNICHLIDHAEDARYGYLVMQSCTGGELFDRIYSKSCTERDSAMAVVDVLNALNFLHSKRIVHRDLKPENLLYKDKAPGAPIKLIDFGLAFQLGPPSMRATEVCGTTSYMAPEVLKGNYATQADIWSLGVITYFMLSGQLPFPGRSDDEKEQRILSGRVSFNSSRAWNEVSDEGKDFVNRLLQSDEKVRLSGKRALHHKWIEQRTKRNQPTSGEVVNSLKKYADAHKFEKAVRHSMATHLTSSELHKLRNTFEQLDTDGAGTISIEDLKAVLSTESKTGHDIFQGLDISHFDLDGDGQVDWREFVAAVMEDHDVYNEDNLQKVFEEADTDKSGTLCHAEISKMLGNDHEFSREILEAIKKARGGTQALGDVKMSLSEFKEMIISSQGDVNAERKSKTGKRKHHAPVSGGQMATVETPRDSQKI